MGAEDMIARAAETSIEDEKKGVALSAEQIEAGKAVAEKNMGSDVERDLERQAVEGNVIAAEAEAEAEAEASAKVAEILENLTSEKSGDEVESPKENLEAA